MSKPTLIKIAKLAEEPEMTWVEIECYERDRFLKEFPNLEVVKSFSDPEGTHENGYGIPYKFTVWGIGGEEVLKETWASDGDYEACEHKVKKGWWK